MSKEGGLGFIKASAPAPGGGFYGVARFLCVGCGETYDLRIQSGEGLYPETIAKRAVRAGWLAHPHRRGRTYCPTCIGKQAANDPNREPRKVTPMAKPVDAPPVASPTPLREATSSQRVAIRSILDKSFDDSVGTYLDGMSDQLVAETIGVPRIVVERIREAAYGPIKVDQEMQAIRSEMTALQAAIDGQQKGVDSLRSMFTELTARLEKKLAAA